MSFSTVTASTLADPQSLLQDVKMVIADIDYTLVDFGTAHTAGMKAIADALGDGLAAKVSHYFNLTLEGLRRSLNEPWREREAFDRLMLEVENCHQRFSANYGPRIWSRETWIHLADQQLTGDQVISGRDSYWQAVTTSSLFYADTPTFLDYLQNNSIPLILMTGSDSILKIDSDLTFDYDPEYSADYKRKRLSHLPFGAKEILIGDPVDKPDQAFFSRVLETANHIERLSHDQVLFMGDSMRNDLEVPRDLGYRTLLVKRG